MDILFITPSYKPAFIYGGPTISVSELAEALVRCGHNVTIYTTTANGREELKVDANKCVLLNGVSVFYFRRVTGDHTHVSFSLWKKLSKTYNRFDIVHVHSWWSILILGSALLLKLKNKKFILSPRGMLGYYSFQNQHSNIKLLLHKLVGKKLLESSILHATTELEKNDCQKIIPNWKNFVLHNLVNLPEKSIHIKRPDDSSILKIGFLSRIDPKKGLEILFHALEDLAFSWELNIAGSGDTEYINSLKLLTTHLSISNQVVWHKWKNGNDKFQYLSEMDIFVLPSYNENFAIAVVESLAVGTPVLVSENVGLADYVSKNKVGFVCRLDTSSIKQCLVHISNNREILKEISQRSIELTYDDFDKSKLASSYLDTYQDLIEKLN